MKKIIVLFSGALVLVIALKNYERVLLRNIISEGYADNHFFAEKMDINRIDKNTVIAEWISQNGVGPILLEYNKERTSVIVVLIKKVVVLKFIKTEFEKSLGDKIVEFGIRKDDGTIKIFQ
jgi:hypothetical protein